VTGGDVARVALAGIRIFNGGTALFAPERLNQRMELEPGAVYPWRMFGIRTLLIGVDLLSNDPDVRRHALRVALLIHVSDTVSAAKAGLTRSITPRAAATATAISAANVVLALVAARSRAARVRAG
jgi:hypothetical protein